MAWVLSIFTSIGKWLRREFKAAWPIFLFFMFGILILLLIIKLTLENYSVEVTAYSKAIVGALLAAKAVLLLDETPLARRLEQYRRIVSVAVKTFLYGAITLLLGYVERILEARHRLHNLDAAVHYVIDHGSIYRLLAWALGISVLFAIYFATFEISESMGRGKLRALFFESPQLPTTRSNTQIVQ